MNVLRTSALVLPLFATLLVSCHSTSAPPPLPVAIVPAALSTGTATLAQYVSTGDVQPVHDPSLIRQGSEYYAFSSDAVGQSPGSDLPIRCSSDLVFWKACGHVFDAPPAWVIAKVPLLSILWAPDVSYFHGFYHVYYAGSTFSSQQSVIGLVTNTTLDAADPAYRWVDQGEVLESNYGDDFNAIDPNILVDTDGRVWLSYGSYWSGIKQREIEPSTGRLSESGTRYDLAARPDTPSHPIEGASLIRHDGYYYLFVSVDYCCNVDYLTDNYKEAVGRSTSPNGPFLDQQGNAMLEGGSTLLLVRTPRWLAPGGGTAYKDASTGESILIFHALDLTRAGEPSLWTMPISWVNDWPSLA